MTCRELQLPRIELCFVEVGVDKLVQSSFTKVSECTRSIRIVELDRAAGLPELQMTLRRLLGLPFDATRYDVGVFGFRIKSSSRSFRNNILNTDLNRLFKSDRAEVQSLSGVT